MKNSLLLASFVLLFVVTIDPTSATDSPEEHNMQMVLGIGGLFFRSENPELLAKWYETHLGISLVPTSYEQQPWQQEAGPTVFAPFKKDTEYFGDQEQGWMVNFRVADLNAMVAQLRTAGIEIEDPKSYPNGTFARLHDPDGNPIELWEPKDPE
jgi:glyoxylase I family protein